MAATRFARNSSKPWPRDKAFWDYVDLVVDVVHRGACQALDRRLTGERHIDQELCFQQVRSCLGAVGAALRQSPHIGAADGHQRGAQSDALDDVGPTSEPAVDNDWRAVTDGGGDARQRVNGG